VITFALTVDGDISTFDMAAFKVSLAAQLAGVAPDDILLTVTSGSVSVIATITPQNATVAAAAQSSLTALVNAGANDGSIKLGVVIQSFTMPTLIWAAPPPSASPPASPQTWLSSLSYTEMGIGIGCGVLVLFGVCIAVIMVRRARRRPEPLMKNHHLAWNTKPDRVVVLQPMANFMHKGGYSQSPTSRINRLTALKEQGPGSHGSQPPSPRGSQPPRPRGSQPPTPRGLQDHRLTSSQATSHRLTGSQAYGISAPQVKGSQSRLQTKLPSYQANI